MYSVRLYDPWTTQPQELVEIDREHHVGKDVIAFFNAGESLHFGGSFPTTVGGTPAVGPTGKCLDYSGSQKTQYPFNASIANGLVTDKGCAALIVCDVDTLTNYGCLIACQETSTLSCPIEVRIGSAATDSKICLTRCYSAGSGGANYRAFDTGANRLSAGAKNVRILTSFPNNTITSEPTVYINGIAYSTSNIGGIATDPPAAPTSVGISFGNRVDGVTQLDGRIYNVWLIGRGVTAAEGIELTRTPSSPYALFADQPIDIWVPSAAPPGGFQAAWARNANSVIQGMRA